MNKRYQSRSQIISLGILSSILTLGLMTLTIGCSSLEDRPLVDFVNPFIGTAGGGNTFPGAVVPWGMVSVSPHNSPGSPSGYQYGEKYFYGFGQVHLSGTGCSDLGSIILAASSGTFDPDPEKYRTVYSNEQARPGYYCLELTDHNIRAELTATRRCSFTQFHITKGKEQVNILLDCGRSLSLTGGGAVRILSDTKIEGYNTGGGFCGEKNRHSVYFAAEFNQPTDSSGIWLDHRLISGQKAEIADLGIGSWLKFTAPKDNLIQVKIGISYVSCENAWQNMETEIPGWDFEKTRSQAEAAWEQQLSRVQVEDGSIDDLTIFYTALYHMLIHPSLISDVNGEYPLMGRSGIGRSSSRERYSIFSLWDTYRTLHPFLTLLYPEKQAAFLQTMVDMYNESGWLPKWELAGNETYMMVGDPASIVIADSYLKGITDFETETAYQAMIKPALLEEGQSAPPIRAGYHELLRYGYIPADQDTTQEWWAWGPVSTALEYCLADWSIGRMARMLGKEKDFQEFNRRSLLYRNLFDSSTSFIRPKLKSGKWYDPFDPSATEGSGSWAGSGGPGYVEGNAWNYNWFVPHDITGLLTLFGGVQPFIKKLNECFNQGYFTITNEPDIAYPYLFSYLPGEEHRTVSLIKKLVENHFSANPNGLPGNDDCGAISGWLVFSALGFYPTCPASNTYQLGIPLFHRITLQLNKKYFPGEKLVIEKTDLSNSDSLSGLPQIFFNGIELTSYQVEHDQIVKGGRLVFENQN